MRSSYAPPALKTRPPKRLTCAQTLMLKLTHVGEIVIAEMFNRASAVRTALGKRVGVNVSEMRAITEAPLIAYGDLRFDGASRIGVALIDAVNRRCIPCEAKLGTKLMARRSFEDRFLKPCSTSHGGTRVRGSMPAILERKLPPASADTAVVARGGDDEYTVDARWVLIVRQQTAQKWEVRGRPALSERCTIALFEELVAAYGGSEAFNTLVRELIEFDYFSEWLK